MTDSKDTVVKLTKSSSSKSKSQEQSKDGLSKEDEETATGPTIPPAPTTSTVLEEKKTGMTEESAPSLYQKFVTSFDAVLQQLTTEDEPSRQKLPSLDIEGVAAYIKEEQPKNIILMVGAGISTSAGIPDFRTPGTGLYDNLAKFNLPHPQAIFDLSFFKSNPEPFYVLARDLFCLDVKPTPCHFFIRLLDEKGLLRRCYTQNIDTLEFDAGIKVEKIVTAHGSHQRSTCQNSSCKKKYDKEWLLGKLQDKEKTVVKCDACKKGVIKPDIVFFGEKLPAKFFSSALTDFPKCDLLIIMGTSLVVQPFASMVTQVPDDTPRLLINLTEVGQESSSYIGNNTLHYGEEENKRDVFYKSTCNEGAMKLARLLGWEDELKAMINRAQQSSNKSS